MFGAKVRIFHRGNLQKFLFILVGRGLEKWFTLKLAFLSWLVCVAVLKRFIGAGALSKHRMKVRLDNFRPFLKSRGLEEESAFGIRLKYVNRKS